MMPSSVHTVKCVMKMLCGEWSTNVRCSCSMFQMLNCINMTWIWAIMVRVNSIYVYIFVVYDNKFLIRTESPQSAWKKNQFFRYGKNCKNSYEVLWKKANWKSLKDTLESGRCDRRHRRRCRHRQSISYRALNDWVCSGYRLCAQI